MKGVVRYWKDGSEQIDENSFSVLSDSLIFDRKGMG